MLNERETPTEQLISNAGQNLILQINRQPIKNNSGMWWCNGMICES